MALNSYKFNINDNPNIWVTVNRDTRDGLTRDSQNYVTEYFSASGDDELESAFTDIVNEIILQSAYYPTLIGGDNTDMDGYITFEDEIGQFMEVKNVTGLMLGDNQLFSGAALTKMMGTDQFGDRYNYTDLGWELVQTVAERIGVTQDVAIEILKQAWADEQLAYTDDNHFSNYIGWYESEDGKYVAHWNGEHTEEDIPVGAKYITRSYGFYGTANVGAIESLGSDMMHIVIKVRTEIETQHQDVVFMIPASLIPVITYHVELNSDDYATATAFKMYTDEQKPIRLLFEVGLRSDINELNITEKLAEKNLVEGQHIHRNDDGTYTFYTNQWGSGNENQEIDYSNPSAHLVTESHFHPNEANERYYYTTDTIIYEKIGTNSYREYTGTKILTGKALEHNMFEFVLKEGTAEIFRAWSSATGTIDFPEISYTKAGRHVYTVTEVNAGNVGYTYDDSSFEVTVQVTDNLAGQLVANITGIREIDGADSENITDSAIVFRNEYTPNPVTLSLEAVKLLENRHLTNHKFTFHLFEADGDFNYSGNPIETAHNSAEGKIAFTHEIAKAVTYYFVMKEDYSNPAVDIVYDKNEYQITVVVYDGGGYLSYHATYAIDGQGVNSLVFSNVFVPQDPVQKDVYAKDNAGISIDGNAVKAGDVLTYEIDYTNFTNQTQADLVITDKIPAGTTYVAGSASQEGFVSFENGMLTWKFDEVKAGEVVVVTFDVKVEEGKADIENKAHVVVGNNEYDTNAVTNYTFDKEVDKAEGLTYVDGSATNAGVYDEATHTITWVIKNVTALADGEVSFKAIFKWWRSCDIRTSSENW